MELHPMFISTPRILLKPKAKGIRTSHVLEKQTHGFDRDYKLLSRSSKRDVGGCLPVAGICNSENETVNYFARKVSKLRAAHFPGFLSFASQTACKYCRKTVVRWLRFNLRRE